MEDFGHKIRVDTKWSEFEIEQSLISVVNGAEGKMSREVIKLKDKGVRDALISLGWTPPDGKH